MLKRALIGAAAVGLILVGLTALAIRSEPITFAGLRLTPSWLVMPGFGRKSLLGPSQIEDLTEYVLALSSRATDLEAVERAIPLFESHCSACHGVAGKGDPSRGTPDLSDDEWIHGSSRDEIRAQVWHGDDGRGPARQARLESTLQRP